MCGLQSFAVLLMKWPENLCNTFGSCNFFPLILFSESMFFLWNYYQANQNTIDCVNDHGKIRHLLIFSLCCNSIRLLFSIFSQKKWQRRRTKKLSFSVEFFISFLVALFVATTNGCSKKQSIYREKWETFRICMNSSAESEKMLPIFMIVDKSKIMCTKAFFVCFWFVWFKIALVRRLWNIPLMDLS